jgi:hypothetical protein
MRGEGENMEILRYPAKWLVGALGARRGPDQGELAVRPRRQHDNRAEVLAEWEARHDEDGNPLGDPLGDPVRDEAVGRERIGDEPLLLVGSCPT